MCCNEGSCSSMQRLWTLPQPLPRMQLKENQRHSFVTSWTAWVLQQRICCGCTILGRCSPLSCFLHRFPARFDALVHGLWPEILKKKNSLTVCLVEDGQNIQHFIYKCSLQLTRLEWRQNSKGKVLLTPKWHKITNQPVIDIPRPFTCQRVNPALSCPSPSQVLQREGGSCEIQPALLGSREPQR